MRQHGTRAAYAFGLEPGHDRSKGCRCDRCTEANRIYARETQRRHARAFVHQIEDWQPAYVDNTEAREHLEWLTTQGVGLRTVGERTGVGRTALGKIRTGKVTKSRPETIAKILSVGRSAARGAAVVDARPTWKLITDLTRQGYTLGWIAQELGATSPSLQLQRERVTAENARKVAELHHRLMWRRLEDRRQDAERQANYRARETVTA